MIIRRVVSEVDAMGVEGKRRGIDRVVTWWARLLYHHAGFLKSTVSLRSGLTNDCRPHSLIYSAKCLEVFNNRRLATRGCEQSVPGPRPTEHF